MPDKSISEDHKKIRDKLKKTSPFILFSHCLTLRSRCKPKVLLKQLKDKLGDIELPTEKELDKLIELADLSTAKKSFKALCEKNIVAALLDKELPETQPGHLTEVIGDGRSSL